MRNLIVSLFLILGISVSANADDACVDNHISLTVENIRIEADDLVYYDLTITNDLDFPIGGLEVEHELWANNRPSALGSGYSQFSHTLGGGILAGETTKVTEYVSVYEREVALARSAEQLEVKIKLLAVADIEGRLVGNGNDPYGEYRAPANDQTCKD